MNAERRDDKGAPDDVDPVGELSYMAASRELDTIVEFFEKSEVDVDQLVARLERATAIVDELDRRIRSTRAQVEELVPKLEAAGRSASAAPPQTTPVRGRGPTLATRGSGARCRRRRAQRGDASFLRGAGPQAGVSATGRRTRPRSVIESRCAIPGPVSSMCRSA